MLGQLASYQSQERLHVRNEWGWRGYGKGGSFGFRGVEGSSLCRFGGDDPWRQSSEECGALDTREKARRDTGGCWTSDNHNVRYVRGLRRLTVRKLAMR